MILKYITFSYNNNRLMIKLGIVGTSGRNPLDKKKLVKEHMEYMAENVYCYIEHVIKTKPNNIILVSGGSAWADHIAVQLYLTGEFAGLELYLPSRFDPKQKKYINTHEGRTLNQLHAECKEKTGIDVFEDLTRAVTKKATKIVIQRGFLPRNTLIAKNSDHLITFTFSPNDPVEGGTFDTWKKTKHDNRTNFDLANMNGSNKVVEI